MSNVAVVILNYNGEKLLKQFLPSVIQYSGTARIIVADNNSTDRSIEVLQNDFKQVEVIPIPSNLGFCGGYNFALKKIEADFFVLLNSDVEVTPNWLTPMLQLFTDDNSVGAIQPKLLSYHDQEKFEYAGAAGGFIDTFGYPFCRGRMFNVLETDTGQYNDNVQIFWATGACMAIRAKLFHSLGGFDERFFAHMEEIDLCWRLHRAGHKVMYCGDSKVFHVGGATLDKSNPKKTYYNFRNGLMMIIKNLSLSDLVFKLPIRIILDWVAAFTFLLSGKGKD
ncbi:MAG: glycosyltransferase family 2 protein, partial [Cyclobacteriaceae bacterium]